MIQSQETETLKQETVRASMALRVCAEANLKESNSLPTLSKTWRRNMGKRGPPLRIFFFSRNWRERWVKLNKSRRLQTSWYHWVGIWLRCLPWRSAIGSWWNQVSILTQEIQRQEDQEDVMTLKDMKYLKGEALIVFALAHLWCLVFVAFPPNFLSK